MSWSISVKTVGNSVNVKSATHISSASKDFTIQVEPNEVISSLHRKIEEITGLKTSQQRLIYRGRLISSGGEDSGNSADAMASAAAAPTARAHADANGTDSAANSHGDGVANQHFEDIFPAAGDGVSASAAKESRTDSSPNSGKSPVMESRICDVAGLSDGQTIHLVPRPISNSNNDNNTSSNNTSSNPTTLSSEEFTRIEPNSSSSGSGNLSMLTALLGLGSSNTSNTTTGNNDNEGSLDDLEIPLSMPRRQTLSRSTTNQSTGGSGGGSTRRRNNYRRTENDPLHPEPCPLEPVRQGLMTLHTMIGENQMNYNGGSRDETNGKNWNRNGHIQEDEVCDLNCKPTCKKSAKPHRRNTQQESPLDTHRKWYIGQWLDCRDTVNQWLEATVIEIMTPEDILTSVPSKKKSHDISEKRNRITTPYTDPAIGANDVNGRKKLLVELAEDENDTTLADLNDDITLIGYKERDRNDNLQLLKIHNTELKR